MWPKVKQSLLFFPRFVLGFGMFGIFCIGATVLLPILWICTIGRREYYRRLIRTLGRYNFRVIIVYLRLIGFIDVRFENLPKSDRFGLIVCNHISMFDIVTILAFIPDCRTFVKAKFLRNPFIRPVMHACGFIPIGDDSAQRIKGTLEALEWLKAGGNFVIFPEGTRTKTGEVGSFHNGAFRLAIESKVPIYPVRLTCSEPVFNNINALKPTSATIRYRARLMPVIAPVYGEYEKSNVKKLSDEVRHAFLGWLSESDVFPWHRIPVGSSHQTETETKSTLESTMI